MLKQNSVGAIQKTTPSGIYAPPNSQQTQPSEVEKTPSKPSLSTRSGGWTRRNRQTLDPMAQYTKSITSRLNKITMDNFANLAGQLEEIFDSQVTSAEQLTKLVSLIFEKTVQEHIYGPLYAKLCVALASKDKVFDEGQGTKKVDFKHILLNVCQSEFAKGKRPPTLTDDMDAMDREHEMIKAKKILMGTMKFIGQLYLSHLLPTKVMMLCLKHLVAPSGRPPSDDDLEGACTLLDTVASTFEEDEECDAKELDKVYQRLIKLSKRGHSARIKILVRNIVDLRKKSWNDKRVIKVEGPKALQKKSKPTTGTDAFDLIETMTASIVPISAPYKCGVKDQHHDRSHRRRRNGRRKRELLETEDE